MVIFAALSLSGSASDYNFSKELATRTSAYYNACGQAEEILAQIDQLLLDGENITPEAITAGEIQVEDDLISYIVPVNDRLGLSVVIRVTPQDVQNTGTTPDTENLSQSARYQIVSWEEILTTEWEGENSVQLLQPQQK
jgi:hypothetical protein